MEGPLPWPTWLVRLPSAPPSPARHRTRFPDAAACSPTCYGRVVAGPPSTSLCAGESARLLCVAACECLVHFARRAFPRHIRDVTGCHAHDEAVADVKQAPDDQPNTKVTKRFERLHGNEFESFAAPNRTHDGVSPRVKSEPVLRHDTALETAPPWAKGVARAYFFRSLPIKSRFPSGTPFQRRMSYAVVA